MKKAINLGTGYTAHPDKLNVVSFREKTVELIEIQNKYRKSMTFSNIKNQIKIIMNKLFRLKKYSTFPILVILLLFSVKLVSAQDTLLVKGVVKNWSNDPIANVAVGVVGSFDLPSVTNEDGEFEVKTTSKNALLSVEPSGRYKSRQIYLNNRTDLEIYLAYDDVSSGDDVISILSQPILSRNIVSAFDVLEPDNIHHTSAVSVDQYMQGRVSGMHIVNRSGDPGSGTAMFIRGVNTLNSSSQPLYVIDGMPVTSVDVFQSNLEGYSFNPLLNVNPLDVSRITVIKDPTVTAAYGSKASNGLVLIETLDPSTTSTVIDVDLRTGYSLTPERQIPQLNADQHKTLINELLFSSGMNEEDAWERYPNLFLTPIDDRFIDYQHDTNWQDLIFSNAAFSNLNISVKGGDEIARYGLSFGYLNGNGIVKTTGYQGYNIRFVGLLNIFTWLKMNTGVSLSYNTAQLKESGKVPETNPILSSLGKSPMLNPYKYDTQGQELMLLAEVDELGVSNPQAVISNYEAGNNNFNFLTTMGLEATLKEYLLLRSNFGITYNALREKIFMPNMGMERYYEKEAHNVAKASNNALSSFYNNSYLHFNKRIGTNHHVTSSTGVNVLTNNYEYDWALTKNSHRNDQYRMLQDGINNLRELGGRNRAWNWISLYESLNYNYRDKYLLSLSVSLDGSSRIGENATDVIKIADAPFGLFYAAGAGWRLSNEALLRRISWLEELKLRVTYGRSGNDDVGESNALRYYEAVRFRETVGLYPAVIQNDELTYETVTQLNGGADLSILGDRFRISADVYESIVENMLIYKPIKSYFGYDFRPENGGRMQNRGIDVSLFYRLVDQPNFQWDIQGSYSVFDNEILELTEANLITEIQGAEIVNMVGEKANSFYGYKFEGVYSTSEEAAGAGLVNDKRVPYGAGDAKYADISGPGGVPDNIINQHDKTVIGSSIPDQFGGLNNSFRFKRFGFSTFLQVVSGHEVFNYIRYQNENMAGLENQSTIVLDRWQYEGHNTSVPRALFNDPIGNSAFSTRWIEDGSYLRVKNVTLSYTIPNEFLTFRNAQFYVSASNVYTVSKYLGYDPEFAYSHSHLEQGIDYGLTPQPRQFILGVKLGL